MLCYMQFSKWYHIGPVLAILGTPDLTPAPILKLGFIIYYFIQNIFTFYYTS